MSRSAPTVRWLQVGAISSACVAAYVGLRSLPVESCEFLHYADFVNADGVLEGCGYEESGFFDMQSLRFPIIVTLQPSGTLTAGQPSLIKMTLHTSSGRPIRYEDIVVSHTERVHALIVDESLQDYQHVHPTPGGGPGEFFFELTPRLGGRYDVYLDFISLISSRRAVLHSSLQVNGSPENTTSNSAVSFQSENNDLSFDLITEGNAPFVAGKDRIFNLKVQDKNETPVTFTPIMDAYAHIVAFAPGREGFAHLHPLNPVLADQDPTNPDLRFVINLDRPGTYRIWAQMNVNDSPQMVPFTINVEG